MDGSLIAHLAGTYGAAIVPTGIVAWLLLAHVRECSDRRRHIYEEIAKLRVEFTAKFEELSANVNWIRGRMERGE